MPTVIQTRRGTSTQWATSNPVLLDGEIGFVTDTKQLKIGDGVTAWNSLSFQQLTGEFQALDFLSIADPSVPSPNHLYLYTTTLAKRLFPKIKGPNDIPTILQPHIARNKIGIWTPPGNATTVPGVFGYTGHTYVGTATARSVTTANKLNRMRRLGIVSAGTAGSLTSFRTGVLQVSTGTGTGLGGFFKIFRFGISDTALVSDARMFVGMSGSISAPTNVNPSTLTNVIGVGHAELGTSLNLYYGGSVAQTPINLGVNFPVDTQTPYELALFSPPTELECVHWQVTNLLTGATASGSIDGNGGAALPTNSLLLNYAWGYRTNNTTALAVGLDLINDYIETDD
jgi:hypothetical protein